MPAECHKLKCPYLLNNDCWFNMVMGGDVEKPLPNSSIVSCCRWNGGEGFVHKLPERKFVLSSEGLIPASLKVGRNFFSFSDQAKYELIDVGPLKDAEIADG